MPGPEVIKRQPGAELANALEHLRGMLRILHHHRLRELELERAAREGGARDHGAQVVDEILPQQLARGQVHTDEDGIALAQRPLPGAQLGRGALQHEHAEIGDEADLLGERDEL